MEIAELEAKARWVRRTVFEMIVNAKKGHLGGSLSCVDIMVALFYQIMKPEDVFILSKGHAAPVLYAILADKGYFPKEELMTFNKPGSRLEGHPHIGIPGVFCNSGSLGNGLGIACGVVMARPDIKVYVLMGDGEMSEGSVLEALSHIPDRGSNIIPIVDTNYFGATEQAKPMVQGHRICGHHIDHFCEDMGILSSEATRIIYAATIKGHGVSFMENKVEWHHRIPNAAEIEQARKELVY